MLSDNHVELNDLVEMKKKHPCGSSTWTVIRVGADIKMKCEGCKRIVMLDRQEFLKGRKKTLKRDQDKIVNDEEK